MRFLLRFIALAAIAWVGGFLWFVLTMPDGARDDGVRTDAIVVLTGGGGRVEAGIALLQAGLAQKLFISGVHPNTALSDLLAPGAHAISQLPANLPPGAITLGHSAGNTAGNAYETAAWMHQQLFRSLRLVTANYHMRRSLLEFDRVMPEMMIIPNPVVPEELKAQPWWSSKATIVLLVDEYDKYLAALVHPLLDAVTGVPRRIEPPPADTDAVRT